MDAQTTKSTGKTTNPEIKNDDFHTIKEKASQRRKEHEVQLGDLIMGTHGGAKCLAATLKIFQILSQIKPHSG